MTGTSKSQMVLRVAFMIAAAAALAHSAVAQRISAPLDRGFARSSSIEMTVDEMLGPTKQRAADEPILGPGYPALWIAEVQYKPVRHVRMPVTDPKTGQTTRELVWYMVYRVIPRDYTELAGDKQQELVQKLDDPNRDPANTIDPVRAPSIIMPRFLLETTDEGSGQTYVDQVNLQIQQSVLKREFRQDVTGLKLLNSVQAVQGVPEPVPTDAENPLENALYGVAIWRNVDPDTDYFTVFMTGFSNAYKITPADSGNDVIEEKVVVQKFGRPGDRFLQDEAEFRVLGDPEWIYRQRPGDLSVPNYGSILRNNPIKAADVADPTATE